LGPWRFRPAEGTRNLFANSRETSEKVISEACSLPRRVVFSGAAKPRLRYHNRRTVGQIK